MAPTIPTTRRAKKNISTCLFKIFFKDRPYRFLTDNCHSHTIVGLYQLYNESILTPRSSSLKTQTNKLIAVLTASLISISSYAIPIEWHGKFGVSTNIINDYRRIDSKVDNSSLNDGTTEVPFAAGQDESANWQNYLFRLEPHIIVNDTATIKAEFTSGYGRGGNIGDSTAPTGPNNTSFGNALYNNNVNNNGNDNIRFNKLYAEIYADTATYLIGRHTYNFGLGAVVNSGDGMWDRFPYLRDGITVKINLGNFLLEPYWTRQGDGTSLTKATRTRDSGISLKYDNVNRDMGFGVLYSKKKSGSQQTDINNGNGSSLGSTDVTLIDLYFKKEFENFKFGLEVPILSGEIGNVYGANTNYKTKAIIFQSKYKMNNAWSFGFDAGQVDGEDGEQGEYGAMYLNPNFHIANLLFRFNTRAVADNNKNIYDSYINNTMYFKFYVDYMTERWKWNFAGIFAKADQVASGNGLAYNHDTNKSFTSTVAQDDNMGFELDMSFDYNWNAEVSIGGRLGWLFTGDYFAYTNDSSVNNEATNSYAVELNTMISF